MKKKKINIDKIICIILSILAVCSVLLVVFFRLGHGYGDSMYPTMYNKSMDISVKYFNVNRFDIVTIKYNEEMLGKRIIGLPGETISCKNNVIYINGTPLEEPFLNEKFVEESIKEHGFFTPDFDEITLEDDEYFYLGDNRPESGDSTNFGPCTRNDIKGKTIFFINFN